MQLPSKIVVVAIIVVLVLIVMMSFFFQTSGTTMTKAEAERIFNSGCLAYAQRGCEWSVTYEPKFDSYLEACRFLYGQNREAFSCLYSYCTRCFESRDLRCSGLCKICSGHDYASVDRETCCLQFETECSGSSVDCSTTCGK